MKKLLTKKEVAELLSVSERTVDYLRKRGLPSHTLGNNLVRFDPDEIEHWIKSKNR